MTDYADWNTPQATASAIGSTSLSGTGLALESGGHLASVDTKVAAGGSTIAKDLAAGGVPALVGRNALVATGATVIGAGAATPLGPYSIAQPGYEVGVQVQANAASTSPFLAVELEWSDSATGLVTGFDTWWLAGSATAPGQTYYGTGPTKGDTLNMQLVNGDTVNSITANLVIAQNSRTYIRDDWRQQTQLTVPSFTNANYDQAAGFLCQTSPTIGAGSAVTRILPLYCGEVRLWANFGKAFDVTVNAIDRNITAAPAGNQIYEDAISAAGGGFLSDNLFLPRCTCTVVITNNGAASGSPGLTIVIAETVP